MYSHGKSRRLSIWSVWPRKNKKLHISVSTVWDMDMADGPPNLRNTRLPPHAAPAPPSAHTPTFSVDATDQLVAANFCPENTPHYCVFLLTSGVLTFRVSKIALFGDRSCPLGNTGGEGEGRPLNDSGDSRQRLPLIKPRVLASTSPAPPSHRGAEGGGSGLLLLNTRPHLSGTRLHKLRRPTVGCAGGRWEIRETAKASPAV